MQDWERNCFAALYVCVVPPRQHSAWQAAIWRRVSGQEAGNINRASIGAA